VLPRKGLVAFLRAAFLPAAAVPRAPLLACALREDAVRDLPGAERTRGDCGSLAAGPLRLERGERRGMPRA